MTKANYPLRLQPSLKITAMETEVYFTQRAGKGSHAAFLAFLDGAGDSPPDAGIGE